MIGDKVLALLALGMVATPFGVLSGNATLPPVGSGGAIMVWLLLQLVSVVLVIRWRHAQGAAVPVLVGVVGGHWNVRVAVVAVLSLAAGAFWH